jgi:hypothetical protein
LLQQKSQPKIEENLLLEETKNQPGPQEAVIKDPFKDYDNPELAKRVMKSYTQDVKMSPDMQRRVIDTINSTKSYEDLDLALDRLFNKPEYQ